MTYRIAREGRESVAVLRVVLHRVGIELHLLPYRQRVLARLIEVVAARKDCETGADRPVKQVRLGENKWSIALQIAYVGGKGERFAEAQEIIRLIGQADIAAGEAADAAGQTDGLLPFFLELEKNVHGALLDVALDFGILGLDLLEVIELVEAQEAEFPQVVAEHVAFAQQQLAANHFIASSRVAAEFNPADEELLLLVEGKRQVDRLRIVMDIRVRHGGKVDETVVAVQLGVVLNRLADL